MDNHTLKKILGEIEEKEDLSLKDIAGKVKLDRSNLSTLINNEERVTVTKRMLGKFQRHFPKYFSVGNEIQQIKHNGHIALEAGSPTITLQDYISELKEDKKLAIERERNILEKLVANSTAMIQLLSALSRHDRAFHDTILRSLARLEGKKEVDLIAEARSSEAAKQIEEMKGNNNA
jgi:hypothetical protein